MELTTIEDIEKALPKNSRFNITEDMLALINGMGNDCGIYQDYMIESFYSHIPVLREMTNVTTRTYVDAIKYCNLKQRMSNQDAWKIVFPDRWKRLEMDGRADQLGQNVTAYNKRPIVSKIDADMAVSVYIQYAPHRHAAIAVNFNLMNGVSSSSKVPVYEKDKSGAIKIDKNGKKTHRKDAHGNLVWEEIYQLVSPKIQMEAANAIIELTKMPDEKDINIKIGISDEAASAQQDIANKLAEIAKQQREAALRGESIDTIQAIGSGLIDNDIIDVED